MPSVAYSGHFSQTNKSGVTTSSWSEEFRINYEEVKPPSNPTKLQPNGWRPMTSWSRTISQPGGVWVGWTGSGSISLKPAYGGGGKSSVINPRFSYLGQPRPVDKPKMPSDSQLLLAAYSKIKDQKVNVGMAVAGAKQTLQTILKDLTVWREASKAVKRRDALATFRALQEYANASTWNKRRKFLRAKQRYERDRERYKSAYGQALANFWLALNFCYMQLAQDIMGSIDELNRPVGAPFVHGRSGFSGEKAGEWLAGSQPACPSLYFGNVTFRYRSHLKTTRYVHLAYAFDNSALRRLSQVGLTNPLTIAYDAMPWTWVFDWVMPLGKWVNNLDSTVGLTWVDGCIGEITTSGFEVTEGKLYANPISWNIEGVSFTPYHLLPARKTFTRAVLEDEPQMSSLLPEVRSPFKDILWKITTIVALIAQRK